MVHQRTTRLIGALLGLSASPSTGEGTTMGTAKYIGRVGALAVALGVGAAIANTPGVALADPSDSGSTSSPAASDSSSRAGSIAASDATAGAAASDSAANAESSSTPDSTDSTSGSQGS